MKRWAILAAAIAVCAAPVCAQSDSGQTPEMVSALVPVGGEATGVGGVRWRTDLGLQNDMNVEMTVAISLPTMPDSNPLITTVPARSSVFFPDVVSESLGVVDAIAPILVQTMGRRSVTIRASVHGVRGAERFRDEPIIADYGNGWYPIHTLQGLSFNDDFRTNIGIVNLGETDAEFVLALQRLPGRNLAVTRINLPAKTLWHMAVQQIFPLITGGDDFSVLVESGARDTYVYGSVIENATNTARFIQAQVGNSVTSGITQ